MSILIKGTNIEDLQRAMLMFSGHEIVELIDHGDLIDRDALMTHKGSAYDIDGHELYAVGTGTILRMPVVIPAERNRRANDDIQKEKTDLS